MNKILPEQQEKTKFEYELICGAPIEVENTCYVHPVTLREISKITLKKYHEYLAFLTLDKDTFAIGKEGDFSQVTAFDILTENCKQSKKIKRDMEIALSIFLKETVIFIPEYSMFVVGEVKEIKANTEDEESEETILTNIIHRDNFDEVVDIIKLQNKLKVKEKVVAKKMSKKAQMLADKRAKGRKMVAPVSNEGGITMESLVSVAGIFTQDLNKVLDWTVYQLHDQYDAFMRQENYKNKYEKYLVGEDPKTLNLEKHWTMK